MSNTAAFNLDQLRRLLGTEHGLSVVSLTRADGTVASSVVNAGLLEHPVTGATVLGFVARGSAYKIRRLRSAPSVTVTVTVRVGWEWAALEGSVELIGPLDSSSSGSLDTPELLRNVFRSAGGTHDDWDEYDRVMAREQRTAALVTPVRVYSNG